MVYRKTSSTGIRKGNQMMKNDIGVSDAFEIVKKAMKKEPEYAYAWHCNIAMCCYDANTTEQQYKQSLTAANDAASRFMKMCFGVETSRNMLIKDGETFEARDD